MNFMRELFWSWLGPQRLFNHYSCYSETHRCDYNNNSNTNNNNVIIIIVSILYHQLFYDYYHYHSWQSYRFCSHTNSSRVGPVSKFEILVDEVYVPRLIVCRLKCCLFQLNANHDGKYLLRVSMANLQSFSIDSEAFSLVRYVGYTWGVSRTGLSLQSSLFSL